MASNSSRRSAAQKPITEGLQAVPKIAADLTTTTSWIWQLTFVNTTAGALTVTVADKNTVPLDLLDTVSLAANTTTIYSFPESVKMIGGINWVASDDGIIAEVYGTYQNS